VERHQGVAEGDKGGWVGAGRPGQVLPQRHDRKQGDDADGNDSGFERAKAT
jgi:hypothetical protein